MTEVEKNKLYSEYKALGLALMSSMPSHLSKEDNSFTLSEVLRSICYSEFSLAQIEEILKKEKLIEYLGRATEGTKRAIFRIMPKNRELLTIKKKQIFNQMPIAILIKDRYLELLIGELGECALNIGENKKDKAIANLRFVKESLQALIGKFHEVNNAENQH